MFGGIILIIIGITSFPLGWFFWEIEESVYYPFVALLIWIIGLLLVPLGIIALFNHEILEIIFDELSPFLNTIRLLRH